MSQFAIRFFYFLKDDIESLKKLTEILNRHGFNYRAEIDSSIVMQPQGVFYGLVYPQGKLEILGVKTPLDGDGWKKALNNLNSLVEEEPLLANDVVGHLTILSGDDSWEDLFEQAKTRFPGTKDDIIALENGKMVCVMCNHRNKEAVYLWRTVDKPLNSSFLLRSMPLLYAGVLRMQALDFVLSDRLFAIRREKEEMQRGLIKSLHTKLVMNQATLMAAEELESEIQGLAVAYGKLVGDQNMIVEGIKDFDTAMAALQRQINAETVWQEPAVVFARLNEPYQQRYEELRNMRDELNEIQEDYRAAMNVVQSKIEVMNSRTNIATQEKIKGLLEINTAMQKQGLVFQYAAGLIEFIVLAYYSHTLWSHLQPAAYTLIPSWIQFVVVMAFSGNIVWATHLLAEYFQGELPGRKQLILALVIFLLLFALIILGSIAIGDQAIGH
jgi:hypothetical protein